MTIATTVVVSNRVPKRSPEPGGLAAGLMPNRGLAKVPASAQETIDDSRPPRRDGDFGAIH
jgi:hypothetical protein